MANTDTTATANDASADLFSVAHDLLTRAAQERARGNAESANKLLLAAGNIMGEQSPDNPKGPPNGTQQVADLLKTGWHEVSQITEQLGMNANRVHVIIGRLKAKGGMETQTVKRYRIVESR